MIVAAAAYMAGLSGFGFALLATPLLLSAGFLLPFVITMNLLISLVTRISVAYRLRHRVSGWRVGFLLIGNLPGLALGAYLLSVLDQDLIKVAAGLMVMCGSLLLLRPRPSRPRSPGRLQVFAAGFGGGILGTTTSLSGIPP